jgi:hypothetical protein
MQPLHFDILDRDRFNGIGQLPYSRSTLHHAFIPAFQGWP